MAKNSNCRTCKYEPEYEWVETAICSLVKRGFCKKREVFIIMVGKGRYIHDFSKGLLPQVAPCSFWEASRPKKAKRKVKMSEWQPMSTAPKDGTQFLCHIYIPLNSRYTFKKDVEFIASLYWDEEFEWFQNVGGAIYTDEDNSSSYLIEWMPYPKYTPKSKEGLVI